jgi:hypothetical protein
MLEGAARGLHGLVLNVPRRIHSAEHLGDLDATVSTDGDMPKAPHEVVVKALRPDGHVQVQMVRIRWMTLEDSDVLQAGVGGVSEPNEVSPDGPPILRGEVVRSGLPNRERTEVIRSQLGDELSELGLRSTLRALQGLVRTILRGF